MYNCIFVFLIATMMMSLTLENLFVFFFFLLTRPRYRPAEISINVDESIG